MLKEHLSPVPTANVASMEPEHELQALLHEAGAAIQDFVATTGECRRRRRTAMSSTGSLRNPVIASTTSIVKTADNIRNSLDRAVLSTGVEVRADILREVILGMVNEAQLRASRLCVMIMSCSSTSSRNHAAWMNTPLRLPSLSGRQSGEIHRNGYTEAFAHRRLT